MKMRYLLGAALGCLSVWGATALTQAPRGGPGGAPPPFEPGRVLPPLAEDFLELTPEQRTGIAKLEAEVKQRLERILTAEQIEAIKRRGPVDGAQRNRPDQPPAERPSRAKRETIAPATPAEKSLVKN